jgi:hypothetical protein
LIFRLARRAFSQQTHGATSGRRPRALSPQA